MPPRVYQSALASTPNMQRGPRGSKDFTTKLVAGAVGAVVLGYHGHRRSRGSKGWTAAWAALGAFAPVLGGLIATAQGFGSRPQED